MTPHRRHARRFGALAVILVVLAQGAGRPAASQAPVPLLAAIAQDVLSRLLDLPGRPVRVLLKGDPAQLRAAALRVGLAAERTLDEFIVTSANAAQVAALSRRAGGAGPLASDLQVASAMTVSDKAMAADQDARRITGGLLGVALSRASPARGSASPWSIPASRRIAALTDKVVAAVSFVPGDTSIGDAVRARHAHRRHHRRPAAAARGVTPSTPAASRPGAHLVNVRVLGGDGSGYTSSVIAGLDWVIANRARYNIRVVNLSLGPPGDRGRASTDPLCSAVARVVGSGIVVVASAGNRGQAPAAADRARQRSPRPATRRSRSPSARSTPGTRCSRATTR